MDAEASATDTEVVTMYLLAAAAPTMMALFGFVAGIAKDGSPLKKEWWT